MASSQSSKMQNKISTSVTVRTLREAVSSLKALTIKTNTTCNRNYRPKQFKKIELHNPNK